MNKTLHFSGLNGLRAIAALAVVFSHTTNGLSEFGLNSFIFGTYPDGNPKTTLLAGFGVSIFFSLSGFLITYLLLEEKKTGEINIRNFYVRRILRIWPLYYMYLLLTLFTIWLYDLPFEIDSILFYILLAANVPFILGKPIALLSHYWSLGVEEQFYSFWPWVVKKSDSILKVTFLLFFALILAKCILRYNDLMNENGNMSLMYNIINITRFHCMLIGAIGAVLYFQKNAFFLKLTDNYLAQSICLIAILLVAINKFHIISFLDNEIIAVISVVLVIGQIQKTNRIINFETPILNFTGKISYGIYVIHPLVIFYFSKLITFKQSTSFFPYIFVYFLVFAITICLSYFSYEYFEKYFLNLKAKYSIVTNSP